MRSPTRCSRTAAATPPITRPGTRSTATRPTRPRRSSSAKRAPAKRPCGCRWPAASRCYNAQPQNGRLFVIEYDDFNPFLDHFADRLSARKQRDPARVLAEWKLWDHMDAILSLGVTSLVDRLLGVPQPSGPAANQINADRLAHARPPAEARPAAAGRLLRQLDRRNVAVALAAGCAARCGFYTWHSWWDTLLGIAVTLAVVGDDHLSGSEWDWLATPWPYLIVAAGWLPWLVRFCEVALRRPAHRPQRPRAQAARRPRCGGC